MKSVSNTSMMENEFTITEQRSTDMPTVTIMENLVLLIQEPINFTIQLKVVMP